MKSIFLIAVLLVTTVVAKAQTETTHIITASAKGDAWSLLGSRTVDYLVDRDEINVEASVFNELKILIKNGPLNMHKCTLHFIDGSTKDIGFPDNVKASTERTIDLKGSYLKLDKVIFWYNTDNKSDAKAVVELWGKK